MAWHGRVHGDTETHIVQSVGDGENACVLCVSKDLGIRRTDTAKRLINATVGRDFQTLPQAMSIGQAHASLRIGSACNLLTC